LSKVNSLLKTFGESLREAQFFVKAGGLGALKDAALSFLPGAQEGDVRSAKIGLEQARARAVDMMMAEREAQRAAEEALKRRKKPAGEDDDVVTGGGRNRGDGGVMDMSRFEIDLTPEGPEAPSGAQWQQMAEAQRAAERQMAESHAKSLEDYLKATREAASKLAAEQARFAQAGAQVGAAFADAVSQGIQALASGGEQDAGQVVANILAGLLQTLGTIVGNVLLPGIGGALGGAIGGLAGAGVRAAAAGPTVNINTFDSRNTREFFEADGGRGFYNAQRTGRGQGGR
jgi:hypothetical protein